MRVAVFTNQFPGPVSTFFARDMRGLIDAGIDVEVFPIYPYDATLWRYVPDILNEKVLPRSKVHHLKLSEGLRSASLRPWKQSRSFLADTFCISKSAIQHGLDPFTKSTYGFIKAWAWAHKYGSKYDHVLAYWGNYAATCAYLYHRISCPDVPFSMFLHAEIDLYRNRVFLEQKLLYANNIIVVCDFNRQFLQQCYPATFPLMKDKIHLHHLGLDLREMPYQTNGRSPKKIIAVGRLEKKKGFDYLINATDELKRRGLHVELDLVGDGTQARSLKEQAARLGMLDQVKFLGWLHFDQVQLAMKQATLLCHPSPEIGDAVPTVIKESMALGTPVIGTNVAGIPELLDHGKCGVLVPPKDVKALADAIEMLVEKPELRQQYALAARQYAERKFDLVRNGQELAAVLGKTSREI